MYYLYYIITRLPGDLFRYGVKAPKYTHDQYKMWRCGLDKFGRFFE